MNYRTPLLAAAILGATGVGLGAFGAHALRAFLMERGTSLAWETAVRYQQLHALALLALAVWCRAPEPEGGRAIRAAVWCWIAGTILFAGSLYGLALGGPRWLGPITPIGGLALLAGWIILVIPAYSGRSNRLSA